MEKKHISIIGSCVSRNLFNNSLITQFFEVDKYAFQVSPWGMCSDGLDIKKEDIYKNYSEEFTARMLWYDICKTALTEIENAHSEYLMIDLYSTVAAKVCKFELNGKIIYSQATYDRYTNFINFIKERKLYPNLNIETLETTDFDKTIIHDGLKLFAEWVKAHFKSENVIIHIPCFAKRYVDLTTSEIKSYNEQKIINRQQMLNVIIDYSKELSKLIPNCKIMDFSNNEETIAQFSIYDDIREQIPTYMHHTDIDYINDSKQLLKLLQIQYSENENFPPLAIETAKYKNMYLLEKNKKNIIINSSSLSLNDYVNKIANLNDIIVLIVARDEASLYIKNFISKEKLEISSNLNWRDSYIAVIDKLRNFVYENNSQEALKYDYVVDDKTIHIESAGFNAGNNSSIQVVENDIKTENLSINKRGLNIVLLNSKTLEVIDQAYCDSFADKDLLVNSTYFANIKIHI